MYWDDPGLHDSGLKVWVKKRQRLVVAKCFYINWWRWGKEFALKKCKKSGCLLHSDIVTVKRESSSSGQHCRDYLQAFFSFLFFFCCRKQISGLHFTCNGRSKTGNVWLTTYCDLSVTPIGFSVLRVFINLWRCYSIWASADCELLPGHSGLWLCSNLGVAPFSILSRWKDQRSAASVSCKPSAHTRSSYRQKSNLSGDSRRRSWWSLLISW